MWSILCRRIPAGMLVLLVLAGSTTLSTDSPSAQELQTDPAVARLEKRLQGLSFRGLLEVAVPAIALRDPENVIASGLADTYNLKRTSLTDISFAYQRVTLDMWQVIENHLERIDPTALPKEDQLSYDIYRWQAGQALARRPFLYHDYQATYFLTGVPPQTERFFSDLHPLITSQDAYDYLKRLKQVEGKFRQLTANLKRMEKFGIIEPAITMRYAIQVHRGTLNSTISGNPYYARFSQRLVDIPELGPDEAKELKRRAESLIINSVNPAYRRLISFLEDQVQRAPARIGVSQFPRGKAFYRERLRFHTTTTLRPKEIHQLGLREVARVQDELQARFDQLGYPNNESLAQKFDRAAVDGGTVLASDAKSTYEALIDEAEIRMLSLFDRQPETEVKVIGGDTGGFYIRASFDGSRPGAFYASTTQAQPYFLMPTLAYHEAMPGHHMQIALAQESDIPLFRRTATFTGYIEGWALYAEKLAGENGWYADDAFGDIGRLNFEVLRAVRLVVDTGIHYYGWSFDKASQYFQDNVGGSRRSAEGNIFRYSLYPGQATAYMVGMLKILELRERMQRVTGTAFSLKDFHALVLDQGSLPLALLEDKVNQTINDLESQADTVGE